MWAIINFSCLHPCFTGLLCNFSHQGPNLASSQAEIPRLKQQRHIPSITSGLEWIQVQVQTKLLGHSPKDSKFESLTTAAGRSQFWATDHTPHVLSKQTSIAVQHTRSSTVVSPYLRPCSRARSSQWGGLQLYPWSAAVRLRAYPIFAIFRDLHRNLVQLQFWPRMARVIRDHSWEVGNVSEGMLGGGLSQAWRIRRWSLLKRCWKRISAKFWTLCKLQAAMPSSPPLKLCR